MRAMCVEMDKVLKQPGAAEDFEAAGQAARDSFQSCRKVCYSGFSECSEDACIASSTGLDGSAIVEKLYSNIGFDPTRIADPFKFVMRELDDRLRHLHFRMSINKDLQPWAFME